MRKRPISKILVPVLGGIGLLWAVYYVNVIGRPQVAEPVALGAPAPNPYQQAISGSGVIEASSRNIDVGSYLSGVVAGVFVEAGQDVKAGAPLFALDSRTAEAELALAKARAADAADQLRRGESVKQGLAISGDNLARRRYASESANAQLLAAQVMLDKHVVRAPVDGRIFQVNIAAGEFVNMNMNNGAPAPVVMGAVDPLYVRISLDENDAWRYTAGMQGTAAVRGNQQLVYKLAFVRVEPYVVPKKSLTGETRERVDTRVLDVIYAVQEIEGMAPLFPGQQLDVFLETAPTEGQAPQPAAQ